MTSDKHDTRAGPGDAGYADRPVKRPQSPADRKRGRSATKLFTWLLGVGVAVVLVLTVAAMI
ncbi:hypothetical protein AL036_06770 [Salipiger aestuarii]|uniref:hypothetical protein n=1 Tax=Salipiger aestuarii TaxID=568098 RepID=UPI00123C6C86|nr:hypothetical protein [Salipiger aestuarii]KAA8608578.1 hypothetical protein AL036_06770 [Salipiger aestuarii]